MLTVKEILKATRGKLVQGNPATVVKRVSTDSRDAQKGDLFIALIGDNFDGHDFIVQAVKKQASALVVSKKIAVPDNIPVISVPDTAKALGNIAQFYRKSFRIPVIAVTGSTGKTTAKEMIAQVLSARYKVLKNISTENNHIGVPLTILRLRKTHHIAVLELGTNHFGEIRYLTQIAQPTVSVLTNIGESHLEFLKNLSGVFKEKFDIVRYMRPGGRVIFNNDDSYLTKIGVKKLKNRCISFGIYKKADYRATSIRKNSAVKFRINRDEEIILHSSALHNVYNALSAICCGRLFKISYNDIRKAIKGFTPPKGRQVVHKRGSYAIIDDTYNSNPLSLKSAIDTLSRFHPAGRKILVCGDMLELGRESKRLHSEIGEVVARSGIDGVFSLGKDSRWLSQAAKKKNSRIDSDHFSLKGNLHRRLQQYIKPGDVILVKGSRRLRMEETVEFLKKEMKGN